LKDDDPEEYGDVYSLTALKSDTRLFLCHHEGSRTSEDAMELFAMVERMRSTLSSTPIFTSDDWDPFAEGLVNIYGILEVPPYKGIGRKPLPILVPPKDLKYVRIEKKKVEGTVVETVKNIVFGNEEDILEMLEVNEDGYIGTSYVERFNLTIRTSLARFIRKGMNFSKKIRMHTKAFDLFQAWYNFIKPHDSLKIKVNCGNRRWEYRTPAMAEKVTDHIWTLGELFGFRVPVK
jgi:IS1 family transposase